MRQRILLPWVAGLALLTAATAMNCGGDDNNGTTGAAGSGGHAGSSTGGHAGTGGSSAGTAGAGGSSAGTAGTAGTGGKGGSGGATGGSAGTGGTAGSAGSGGQKDAGDSGSDAPTDTSTSDVKSDTTSSDAPSNDSSDAAVTSDAPSDRPDGSVAFAAVTAIFNAHCIACHKTRDSGTAPIIDLQTPDGLYTRLTTPLPTGQEGQCGFPAPDASDDAGDGATPPNRQAIVPGDTSNSLLYRKIAGTQPTGCGVRMPRVNITLDDGGASSVGCDNASLDGGAATNCLSQADLDTIGNWITQGAPQN